MANSSKTQKKAKATKGSPVVQYAAVSPQPSSKVKSAAMSSQPSQPPRRPAIAAARRIPVHYTPRIPNAGCPTC